MSMGRDMRELATWADGAARWLEQTARHPNDEDDPMRRTVTFDASSLDEFLTGFRGLSGVIEAVADSLEERPEMRVIAGGRR